MNKSLVTNRLKRLAEILRDNDLYREADAIYSMTDLYKASSDGPQLPSDVLKAEEKKVGVEGDMPFEVSTEEAEESESKPKKKKKKKSRVSSLLKLKDKSKESVEKLQRALVRAGFRLPRYGIDGEFGRETSGAVKRFKRKAKKDGKYSGEVDGSVDDNVLALLESYPANPSEDSGASGKKDSSSFTLFVGDSQMSGHLGSELLSSSSSGKTKKLSRGSTTAADWVKSSALRRELRKVPDKIVISLNGNGVSGTVNLINLILDYLGDEVEVIWTGAPPPIKRTSSSYKYLNTKSGFAKAYKNRKKRNDLVKGALPSKWTFIDPYDYIKYEEPKTLKIGSEEKTFESGYECNSCDGLHLPSHVAKAYVSKISHLV